MGDPAELPSGTQLDANTGQNMRGHEPRSYQPRVQVGWVICIGSTAVAAGTVFMHEATSPLLGAAGVLCSLHDLIIIPSGTVANRELAPWPAAECNKHAQTYHFGSNTSRALSTCQSAQLAHLKVLGMTAGCG